MDRYITEFTSYIAPDGQEYHFDALDRFLVSEEGWGMPPIEYITQKGPLQHGETVIGYRLQPRVIQLVHRARSCDRLSYWNARATLLNILRPNRSAYGQVSYGVLRKILGDGTTRDLQVMIEQGPAFSARDTENWSEFSIIETLRFIAHDPILFDPNIVTVTWTLSEEPNLLFPTDFTLETGLLLGTNAIHGTQSTNYQGTWETFPWFEITGPITNPTITNKTTGKKIAMVYAIQPGEVVTITLDYGRKTIVNNYGVNLIGTLSSDSDLVGFSVVPDPQASRGINQIDVDGVMGLIGLTEVEMNYYARYIGI